MTRRGELWWAELPEPRGSEPGFRRPILIVQSDDFNHSRIQTILAVAVSSNLRLAEAPGNVLLNRRFSGLPKDSVANVSQIITVDKNFLAQKAGELPEGLLRRIEAGLKLILSLS